MDEGPGSSNAIRSARNVTAFSRSRSLGTISSSRCQTTRATHLRPWKGSSRVYADFCFTDEHASGSKVGLPSRSSRQLARLRLSAPARQPSSRFASEGWWSQTGSNRRPPACKAGALPTELWPRMRRRTRVGAPAFASEGWWAWEDLNFRPHAYQARALTN